MAEQSPRLGYDDPKMEERDRWIYENRQTGKSSVQIMEQLKNTFAERGWKLISTEQGIEAAVNRYVLLAGAEPLA